MANGLPRRQRNVSPIIEALLAQASQPLPPRSSGLNVLSQILQTGIASRALGVQRKQDKEEQQQQTIGVNEALSNAGVPDSILNGLPLEAKQSLVSSLLTRQFGSEEQDPFTLGPGQTRFGAGGQEIASVPAQPDEGGPLTTLQEVANPTNLREFRRDDPEVDRLIESGDFIRAPLRSLQGGRLGDLTSAQQEDRRLAERGGKIALLELGTALTGVILSTKSTLSSIFIRVLSALLTCVWLFAKSSWP